MNIDRQKYNIYKWIITYNPDGNYTRMRWVYNKIEIQFLIYDEKNCPIK